ncbi:cytochrome P450 [Mycena alexandri]|uniref:Cytochrome P450 n=1 Tax=Mycena alexandri TaxID=1745969 RepID=A0AAD6SCU6_9AGAR|nr:cytochrome P450 [Mycena alexandri]
MANLYLYIALSTAALALILRLRRRSRLPLPPGPRKLPLVGNMYDLPATFQWKAYTEWSRKYDSDIIHLNLAGQSLVVLSSWQATDDLLQKRSLKYSDRSSFPMLCDLMGWDFNLLVMKYGPKWRTHRRLFDHAFNVKEAQKFRPINLAASRGLLRRLLQSPGDFRKHIQHMAAENIMSVSYGIDILPDHDPYIALAQKLMKVAGKVATPGTFLVDSIPLLKYVPAWFPGAGFKRKADEWRDLGRQVQEVPFAEVKHQIAAGTARYSFSAQSLHNLDESENAYYTEKHIQATASVIYMAGSDSTIATVNTFILAMLANPEAQRKAQLQIDSVTGQTRLPDFSDEDALPYVSALVKEILRWRPVAPIAVPHFLGVEDEYRGFRIPANSIIIGNVSAILHDEVMYPEPDLFTPERFLLDGKLNPEVRDPQATFGFGRRMCPGRHMATASLWISVASILAAFDITKAVAEDGQMIEPTYEYLSDLISAPAPFECSIRPRSRNLESLIEGEVN